jgi:hypothetical protein
MFVCWVKMSLVAVDWLGVASARSDIRRIFMFISSGAMPGCGDLRAEPVVFS